jgi:hypothetical protein
MEEEEIWVEITTKPNDWWFYTVEEPIKGIWYEQSLNSHRFKVVDGKRYYHENGTDKKFSFSNLKIDESSPILYVKEEEETLSDRIKRLSENKQRLLTSLQALQDDKDYERAHSLADDLLLAYIGDKEVTEAFNKINKY